MSVDEPREAWPLGVGLAAEAKLRVVKDLLPDVLTWALSGSFGLSLGLKPGRLRRSPGLLWHRLCGGESVRMRVQWTTHGLVAEEARVALTKDTALLLRAFSEPIDLTSLDAVALLPLAKAPPQCTPWAGQRWLALGDAVERHYLLADEGWLSVIGRCAGWHDPRLPTEPRPG